MFDQSGKPQQGGGVAGANAFLGKGAKVVGKITLDGPAQIEGEVEGEIESRDTLTIGQGAKVKAMVKGTTVIVHGHVTGDITAQSRLELHNPSRVEGNVTTASLVVHEGAVLNGQCTMGDTRAKIGVSPTSIEPPAAQSTDDKVAAKGR
jgi:cytoskeletal protein CcmA (bactofilin family)